MFRYVFSLCIVLHKHNGQTWEKGPISKIKNVQQSPNTDQKKLFIIFFLFSFYWPTGISYLLATPTPNLSGWNCCVQAARLNSVTFYSLFWTSTRARKSNPEQLKVVGNSICCLATNYPYLRKSQIMWIIKLYRLMLLFIEYCSWSLQTWRLWTHWKNQQVSDWTKVSVMMRTSVTLQQEKATHFESPSF